MLPSALHAIAEQVIVYDGDRDPDRVIIAGAAVGVSRGLSPRDVILTERALAWAIHVRIESVMGVFLGESLRVAERLVQLRDDGDGRFTILVCGSDLVGAEEPAAAESRALSMRGALVSELQRALAGDEPPATVRRSVPASLEAR